jgi:hypothetical protein
VLQHLIPKEMRVPMREPQTDSANLNWFGNSCIMMNLPHQRRALNSAVECHLHTVEVIGSNPIAPTIF